ncbi:proline-rich protein 36 [Trachinotus anak]|uniref:proline-rich protein 36 n=1 Tax=Trachinotus anak TaxID=443729 RepID=UPI0039F18194
MKPDGVTMETTEPTEAAAVADPSSLQDNSTEQPSSKPEDAANDAAPTAAPKANGKTAAVEPKVKPKATKTQPTGKSAGVSGSNSRPGTASHRMVNDVKSSNNVSAAGVKKTTTTAAKASTAGAVPKRPLGAAAGSTTVKNQTRVPDKKSVGPTRTTSVAAATVTNGTKPTSVNGTPKRRPVAETVNAARPKTAASTNRPTASTAPKPSTATTTTKGGTAAVSKTTRLATAPPTARPASTTSRPTAATNKPSTTATAKTAAAARVTVAPSTGRTTAAPPPRTAAAKKDVSRPPSAPVGKKPATATGSAATKKPEPSKPVATAKLNAASKWSSTAKAPEPKVPQSKTQQPAKPPAKKPVAAVRLPAPNKPPLGRTPPASPASRPANGSTSQAKRGTKPTQAVPPFTAVKKTGGSDATTPAVEAQTAAAAAVAAATAAAVLEETQAEAAAALPQGSFLAASAPEEVPPPLLAQDTPPEVVPQEPEQSHAAAPTPPQSPVRTALPQTPPPQEQLEISAPLLTTQEQIPAPAEPTAPPVASPPDLSEEPVYLLTNQTPSTSETLPAAAANVIPQIVPPTNLNEEDDEEERERSQLVSMSEMSGTTQPTEESHPGSAGPVGGSAWRASGALLSELDSEDVSGSQQGASEFSTPGVMEGTESMDDLGDGSLKGAIDMEGASAGSPDSEKVPDIPANDFDEDEDDDDDDDDRVCDMDVGSERTDELQRPRHDNDVDDDEEDEDVEMASEGVTESGLESYGNADEDDFAEDERLDNLNRVAQPPPPPPLLPSAPAAQWDQPNPFADHWAEPLQPQQVHEHLSQAAGAAVASPLDPWQTDSETPTQAPAQAWLELGSAPPFDNENQDAPHHSSVKDDPQDLEAQMYLDQPSPAPMQTLAPAPLSAPGMSLSSTLSSETSTPEELGDYNQDGKLQPQDAQVPVLSPQHSLDYQDLGIHLERGDGEGEEEEAEAETLPADEVLGGPATAPTSNPSSSSVTEDEASDTEGEAQLDDSLESPAVSNITFDSQPPAQRCLSTVEEGEEAETEEAGAGEDTTPPSATSLASYGFDTMTTASSSNAQSTGESCIKSPGIFSLEELPEEAKEPCLIPQPLVQPCLAEQQYIECGKQEAESAEPVQEEAPGSEEDPSSTLCTLQQPEENPDDIQPPYYSAICEKTENSFAGLTALPHPHRRDHSAYPRTYCDIVIPHGASVAPPKLTCADLPPRSPGQKALSPQLLRLEQHQRQLLEMQQRRDQQSRPLEEAELERKRREEEEQRKKKEEAEEEIKRNKEEAEERKKEEELKQRRDLELQLQQQQQELKQRQQIMQWQQELQQSNKGQTVLLSPSSGLCTIYEALENSDEEEAGDEEQEINELNHTEETEEPEQETSNPEIDDCERVTADEDKHRDSSEDPPPPHQDSPQTPSSPSQDGDSSSPCPPESPERPPPLDLDWGKKVDIVQQLINQTLLLNGDGCSSLLLMPGGAGGTLSPLESSLWPSLLPPLTPPSATVTSVSSFSPEASGSSPQGEWTVVELETHH